MMISSRICSKMTPRETRSKGGTRRSYRHFLSRWSLRSIRRSREAWRELRSQAVVVDSLGRVETYLWTHRRWAHISRKQLIRGLISLSRKLTISLRRQKNLVRRARSMNQSRSWRKSIDSKSRSRSLKHFQTLCLLLKQKLTEMQWRSAISAEDYKQHLIQISVW